jgi:pyridoxal phosphate enzyme (YggS family)
VEALESFIAGNLARVRERIGRVAERSGRQTNEITIVAVSKTVPVESILAAHEAGLRQFGENRIQEWEAKRPKLTNLDATWHFIGHLQSNKASRAARLFDRVDSVDSILLAQKLNTAAEEAKKRLPILLEVRLSDEPAKTGACEVDLPRLAKLSAQLRNLELLGLMTIPPYFEDATQARPYFRKLRELRDHLSGTCGRALPVLSMGMSHDFEVAIEEGATEIRIGTDIFGERPKAKT